MKKFFALLLVVLLLFGCSKKTQDISGYYQLVGLVTEEGETSAEDLEAMRASGLDIVLMIEGDVAILSVFGEEMDFECDMEKKVLRLGEEEIPYKYVKGVLTREEDDTTMTFALVEE